MKHIETTIVLLLCAVAVSLALSIAALTLVVAS